MINAWTDKCLHQQMAFCFVFVFIGHITDYLLTANKHPKTALTWAQQGRSHGRPKETWRRTAEKERTALGFGSWSEATVAAHDGVTWRRRMSGPIPTKGYGQNLLTTNARSVWEHLKFGLAILTSLSLDQYSQVSV